MAGYKDLKDPSDAIKQELKLARKAFASTERTNAESLWRDLAVYVLPNQNTGFLGDTTKGKQPDTKQFKSEPAVFCRDLSNAVYSTLTNPAMEWCRLGFTNDELNSNLEGIAWRQNAIKLIHRMLTDSNFYAVLGECYQPYFALGTFVLFHEELNRSGAFIGSNFQTWHLSQLAYLENHLGDVDTIYRKFKMTSKQLVDKFGSEACGETVVLKSETDPDCEYTVFICIKPRDEKDIELSDVGMAPPNKRPYKCLYILCTRQSSRVF